MTSRALNLYEAGAFDGALIDTDAGPKKASFECEDPAFVTMKEDGLYVSRAEGLRAAKGALTAVGLDVAAAFCLYGMWEVWHLFR